jgi:hypothetical protein
MSASLCKPSLSHQVLRLLKEHGPVSIDLLHRMTEPPAPKTNLRQSLSILKKKGLVNSVSIDSQKTFYHLSQAKPDREAVADMINVNAETLSQPLLRKQDWMHNQWCEYWIHLLSKLFPEAAIIREQSIAEHDAAKGILQLQERDFDLMPDFLLSFPKTETAAATHIAFEIERTRKSNERLMRKFRKYLNRTKIDGLIYICDSGRLSETIRLLYETKLVAQAHRIKHYGDHFFLFSDSLAGGGPTLDRLMNAKSQPVEIQHWCRLLRETKWTQRRDAEFARY